MAITLVQPFNLNTTADYTFANVTATGNAILSGNITTASGTNANLTIDPDGSGYFTVTSTTPAVFGNTLSVTGNVYATTLGANINFANNTASYSSFKGYSLITNARGSISGSQTIDLSLGNYVTATITGATAWTFSNPIASPNASGFVLVLTNGGSATQTWPTNTKWPAATAPTLTAAGVDVLVFITSDGGTTWRGVISMSNSS
jgi:hypothetical protein